MTGPPNDPSLSHAFRWAMESAADPAMAAADWLARDIDPHCDSAIGLLTDPAATVDQLRHAKNAFKTMRVVGQTAADRRLAARLYLSAIAAALVRHGLRISSQSPETLRESLQSLIDDATMPETLKSLASKAMTRLAKPM